MDKSALDISPQRVTLTLPAEHDPLTANEVLALLEQQKVTYGIDHQSIEDAVNDLQHGKALEAIVIAEAKQPERGTGSSIKLQSNVGDIVTPGEVIAIINVGEPGTPGTTVFGEAIEPPSSAELTLGDNTQRNDANVLSTRYGTVSERMGVPYVTPLLSISHDKLEACLDIHPTSTVGTPITREIILDDIRAAGITFGINEGAIDITAELQTIQRQVTVALGLPAEPACKADFLCHVTLNGSDPRELAKNPEADQHPAVQPKLVEQEDLICTETPATAQTTGKNIFGEDIKPPPSKTEAPPLSIGEGLRKEDDSGDYFADVTPVGYLTLIHNKLVVTPPIKVSDDGMHVYLTAYPQEAHHLALSRKHIDRCLEKLNVTYGIDHQAIDDELIELRENTQKKIERVIANGRPGVAGEDEYLKYLINHQANVGKKTDDDRVDFHERSTIKNVEPEQPIATIIPATKGQSQIDVFGNPTPATEGKHIGYIAGDGVRLEGDTFYAIESGALLIQGNIVSVSDIFEWDGDVGYKSGNLHHETGAIHIKGNIESGFKVDAKGHVIISQNIDNASVTAGGDVVVNGGIIERDHSDERTMAAGNITAKFAQNAKLYAYHDIIVTDSAVNSTLHAKGSITITQGKGHLVGGVAKAGKTITVKHLGSPAGAKTTVVIEIDPKLSKSLHHQIAEYLEQLQDPSLNQEDVSELNERIQRITIQLRNLTNNVIKQGAVIIEGTVHPGVSVKILDQTYTFKEEQRRCKVRLVGARVFDVSPIE
ncbi:flagellar assembly protein A [Aurantivibrio plasticivorans]